MSYCVDCMFTYVSFNYFFNVGNFTMWYLQNWGVLKRRQVRHVSSQWYWGVLESVWRLLLCESCIPLWSSWHCVLCSFCLILGSVVAVIFFSIHNDETVLMRIKFYSLQNVLRSVCIVHELKWLISDVPSGYRIDHPYSFLSWVLRIVRILYKNCFLYIWTVASNLFLSHTHKTYAHPCTGISKHTS